MLKIWIIIFLFFLIILILTILTSYKIIFLFVIYTELFWIYSYSIFIFISFYVNDPRLLCFSFVILLLASIEIILISIYLISSN